MPACAYLQIRKTVERVRVHNHLLPAMRAVHVIALLAFLVRDRRQHILADGAARQLSLGRVASTAVGADLQHNTQCTAVSRIQCTRGGA